jgi:hypothetical protein
MSFKINYTVHKDEDCVGDIENVANRDIDVMILTSARSAREGWLP